MSVDAVVAAGDGRAAKKIFMHNKSLLELGGKPVIRHVVEALLDCPDIDQVVVVGPQAEFEQIIGDLPVCIVPQRRNLTENGWEGFLQTLPEYRRTGVLTPEMIERYRKRHVLFLSGDIPLLTSEEISEFLRRCDMERYDYVMGMTSEEVLDLFGPRRGFPGIKMATFHLREGNVRQNNLHLARPFLFQDSIDIILKVYECRYQKEPLNILRSVVELVRIAPAHIGQILVLYGCLQTAAGCTALGLDRAALQVSRPVTMKRLAGLVSEIFGVSCIAAETTTGGAALDIDNEKDFLVMSFMYRQWQHLIRRRARQLS